MKRKVLFLCLMAQVMFACHGGQEPQTVAERFLAGYLDCRFSDVTNLASPQVEEQMRWRASQLTQAEVELLSEQTASVVVDAVEDNGTSCLVTLRATNALVMDSIGQPGHIGEARYRITLQKGKGRNWIVTALAEGL